MRRGDIRSFRATDGQQIARAAFDLVWHSSRGFDRDARDLVLDALAWSSGNEPELRLELMLELLARELDPAILVEVFRMLAGAKPNRIHFGIALSDAARLVTTNQDLLLEEAGRRIGRNRRVLHIHGRFDKPKTIITLLSQYVEGLPIPTSAALNEAVEGRTVVVLGYSGRDRDIMPLLAGADSILWVHHRTSRRTQPKLAGEVEILRAQLGSRFQLEVTDTTDFVFDQISPTARRGARQMGAPRPVRTSVPTKVRRDFGDLPALAREHAIARLTLHLSSPEVVLRGVRSARRLHRDSADGRMLEADALLALNRRPEAIALYRKAGELAADPATRCAALLNQAHAIANSSNYTAAREVLAEARKATQRLTVRRRRLQLQGQIAALAGRMKGMTDDEPGAMRDYARARRAFKEAGDLDGFVLASTFGSDMLRSRGRYREALAQLGEIFADSELYARPYARSWAPFYRGAVLGAMGCTDEGLADLRQAAEVGAASGNAQAVAWSKVMLADYLRESDLGQAEEALDDCAEALEAYGGTMFGCEARLSWERAEIGRARGEAAEVRLRLDEIQKMLSSSSVPGRLPYLEAHVLAVEGELARDLGDPSAGARLQKALEAYRTGKWGACAARIEVSLWLLHGGQVPRGLLTRCRNRGYGFEVERLEGRRSDPHYPLHTF